MIRLTRQEQDRILTAHGIVELASDEVPIFNGKDFVIVRPQLLDKPYQNRHDRRAAAKDARRSKST
ncbi:hypothetical protein [Phyllobacterium calauticae]|jgi:hypothetical protein|uniref:hypothetical protein n=1 Tax=Phyllobacterium calauticae TaxID=2817027 RepID=UPI001CBAA3F5|nr:hypothetical protein [Phyllobacterium calauticae]MBZ3693410.1 hypothetical protein [Phyllobacterium calauticae]